MMCFFQHFICNVWILCHIEMGGGMYVCGGGEEKRKGGYIGNKKEKRNGEWGSRVWWGKRRSGKDRRIKI